MVVATPSPEEWEGGGGGSEDDGRDWMQLKIPDYCMLILAFICQFFALAVCLHLFLNRHWPPYVTKNVTLVIITGVSGALWSASMTISWGYWDRNEGHFLARCDFEAFLAWSSVCLHAAAFVIRPYRVWKLLVKHDGKMWRTEYQIFLMSSPCLLPTLFAWLGNSTKYEYDSNFCGMDSLSIAVSAFMNMIGLVIFLFLWCVCVRQLRGVRRQYNEYESLTWSLSGASVMLVTYPVVINFLLASEPVCQRRLALVYPVVTIYVMFWAPIRAPFVRKLMCDEAYLLSYTKGFSSLPTPAQLRASLAEQLSVDQLRAEFRKYIKTKVAQELIDFYEESLDREEVTDFFERQAVTMRIMDRFIRVGAKEEVNISQQCRERVLEMDATDFLIFDEARSEVLHLMETNFQQDFSASAAFREMAEASEKEARELSLLRAEGVVPDTTNVRHHSRSGSYNSSVNRGLFVMRNSSYNSAAFRRHECDGGTSDSGAGAGAGAAYQRYNGNKDSSGSNKSEWYFATAGTSANTITATTTAATAANINSNNSLYAQTMTWKKILSLKDQASPAASTGDDGCTELEIGSLANTASSTFSSSSSDNVSSSSSECERTTGSSSSSESIGMIGRSLENKWGTMSPVAAITTADVTCERVSRSTFSSSSDDVLSSFSECDRTTGGSSSASESSGMISESLEEKWGGMSYATDATGADVTCDKEKYSSRRSHLRVNRGLGVIGKANVGGVRSGIVLAGGRGEMGSRDSGFTRSAGAGVAVGDESSEGGGTGSSSRGVRTNVGFRGSAGACKEGRRVRGGVFFPPPDFPPLAGGCDTSPLKEREAENTGSGLVVYSPVRGGVEEAIRRQIRMGLGATVDPTATPGGEGSINSEQDGPSQTIVMYDILLAAGESSSPI